MSTAKEREVVKITGERIHKNSKREGARGHRKREGARGHRKREGARVLRRLCLLTSPCLLLQELYIETIEKVDCPCQIFVDYIH
jgi:hypothetical protein